MAALLAFAVDSLGGAAAGGSAGKVTVTALQFGLLNALFQTVEKRAATGL